VYPPGREPLGARVMLWVRASESMSCEITVPLEDGPEPPEETQRSEVSVPLPSVTVKGGSQPAEEVDLSVSLEESPRTPEERG